MAYPTDGLVSYFSLDGISGGAVAADYGAVGGTLSGAVPIESRYGQGLRFARKTDTVQLSSAYDFIHQTHRYALVWQMRLSAIPANDVLLVLGNTPATAEHGIFIAVENRNGSGVNAIRVSVTRGVSGSSVYTFGQNNAAVVDEQWHNYVVQCDGTTVSLWVDGVLFGQQHFGALEPLTDVAPRNMSIGHLVGWTQTEFGFLGDLDEVFIYNRPLTAAEIAMLAEHNITMPPEVTGTASGSLLALAYQQGRTGSGRLLALNLSTTLNWLGTGRLLGLCFRHGQTGVGRLLGLGLATAANPARRRFKGSQTIGLSEADYDIVVRIAGLSVPMCELAETMTISHAENQSYLCDFVLRKARGLIDPHQWHGKPIEVDIVTDAETVRLYTGIVDIGRIEFPRRAVVLSCSDRRRLRNNALGRNFLNTVGYTSKSAHGEEFKDQDAELTARLETIPYSFEYDARGIGYLTAWQPKATPDFVMGPCFVYAREPAVTLAPVGRVVNQVNIKFENQYTRQLQRDLRYTFNSGMTVCEYEAQGLPPKTEQIAQAAKSTGWAFGSYEVEGLEKAGFYRCLYGNFFWSPVSSKVSGTKPKTDANGNPVKDQNGNNQVDVTSVTTNDYTKVYARNATWTASKRWVQNITEQFEIVLTNAPSIERYELIEENLSYGVQHKYEDNGWGKDYQVPQTPIGHGILSNGDYYRDFDNINQGEYAKTMQVALNTGYTKILSSHRQNMLDLQIKLMPHIDLRHTHRIEHPNFKGNVKVASFKHSFDMGSGLGKTEVQYRFYQSARHGEITPPPVPSRPSYRGGFTASKQIYLRTMNIPQNSVGNVADSYVGYITRTVQAAYHSQVLGTFAERREGVMFKVLTPEIEKESSDTGTAVQKTGYTVNIPNNPVEIRL